MMERKYFNLLFPLTLIILLVFGFMALVMSLTFINVLISGDYLSGLIIGIVALILWFVALGPLISYKRYEKKHFPKNQDIKE